MENVESDAGENRHYTHELRPKNNLHCSLEGNCVYASCRWYPSESVWYDRLYLFMRSLLIDMQNAQRPVYATFSAGAVRHNIKNKPR